LFSNEDIQGLTVSVDGKKVSVSSGDNAISHLASNLPPEAAQLLASIQGQIIPPKSTIAVVSHETTELFAKMPTSEHEHIYSSENKRNISETNPNLGEIIKNEISHLQSSENQELVRARSAEMQIAVDRHNALDEIRKATDLKQKLTIHECGVALGIVVGSTTKAEVAEIMKNFSKVVCAPDDNDLMFFYSDVHVTVYYKDDMVVGELQFGDYYRGQTSKGLQLGDPLEKALELYGAPRMKSPRGAFWNKFGVFCANNRVNSIRIQA
jgi:hypothetical protein